VIKRDCLRKFTWTMIIFSMLCLMKTYYFILWNVVIKNIKKYWGEDPRSWTHVTSTPDYTIRVAHVSYCHTKKTTQCSKEQSRFIPFLLTYIYPLVRLLVTFTTIYTLRFGSPIWASMQIDPTWLLPICTLPSHKWNLMGDPPNILCLSTCKVICFLGG